MNGVSGLPPGVPPQVGGDAALSPQETRRPNAERLRAYESAPPAAKTEAVDQGSLEKMVKEANQSLSAITSLHISLDRDHNKVVVQVVDKSDENKVIRQFPSEDVMELSKRIDALRDLKGFFLNTKA